MLFSPRAFFSEEQLAAIRAAIAEAERMTSGEIRVHIENRCPGEALDRATALFDKLGMNQTKEHNGVLFYLAVRSRKFAVAGDSGIHAHVGPEFWDALRSNMEQHFKEGKFTEGLCAAILEAGKQLQTHFPNQPGDVNELSDEISIG